MLSKASIQALNLLEKTPSHTLPIKVLIADLRQSGVRTNSLLEVVILPLISEGYAEFYIHKANKGEFIRLTPGGDEYLMDLEAEASGSIGYQLPSLYGKDVQSRVDRSYN